MHVPHALTTPTAWLLPLLMTLLLTLTSATDRGWGMDGGGGGQERRADVSEAGRLHLQETGTPALCDNARLQCTVRTGCQMALTNFFQGCQSLLSGAESACSTTCQHALVSLLTTEDGAGLAFMHCDCAGQQVCEERKRRVQVCQQRVLLAMDLVRDHQAILSCSLARWICEADTSCLAALQYYVQHCSKLFTGTRCTARCRNSVHILYRQPNAHKLRTCRCEGDEDYDCPSLINNTERLCLQRHRHNHSLPHHHHLHHHLHDYRDVGEGGDFRQPGRRTAASNSQSQSSGQTSGVVAGSSGVAAATQHKPFRRRQRRNKPGRKKPRRKASRISSNPVSKSKDHSDPRVLKRRAGQGRRKVKGKGKKGKVKKVRRGRRKRCTGRKGRGREKRRSSRKRRVGRKGKRCPSPTARKQRSALLRTFRQLTRFKRRKTLRHGSKDV